MFATDSCSAENFSQVQKKEADCFQDGKSRRWAPVKSIFDSLRFQVSKFFLWDKKKFNFLSISVTRKIRNQSHYKHQRLISSLSAQIELRIICKFSSAIWDQKN